MNDNEDPRAQMRREHLESMLNFVTADRDSQRERVEKRDKILRRIFAVMFVMAFIQIAGSSVNGCETQHLRAERDEAREQLRAFRSACANHYLELEPDSSRVVAFRKACSAIGAWSGPTAPPQ